MLFVKNCANAVWVNSDVTRCTIKAQLIHWQCIFKCCVHGLCFGLKADKWYGWLIVFGCICCVLFVMLLCFVQSCSDECGCEWIVFCDLFVFCGDLVEYWWCMSILSMMSVLLSTAAQRLPMICMLCVKAQKIHIKDTTYLRVLVMLSHLRPHVHKNQLKAVATSQKRHQTSYLNTKKCNITMTMSYKTITKNDTPKRNYTQKDIDTNNKTK